MNSKHLKGGFERRFLSESMHYFIYIPGRVTALFIVLQTLGTRIVGQILLQLITAIRYFPFCFSIRPTPPKKNDFAYCVHDIICEVALYLLETLVVDKMKGFAGISMGLTLSAM